MLWSRRRRSHVHDRSPGHFKAVLALVRHGCYLQQGENTDDTSDTNSLTAACTYFYTASDSEIYIRAIRKHSLPSRVHPNLSQTDSLIIRI